MSCDRQCSVVLPRGAVGGLRCVILVFPDHTHLLFLLFKNRHQGYKTFSCSTHLSMIFGIFIIIKIEISETIFLLRTVDPAICPGHKF